MNDIQAKLLEEMEEEELQLDFPLPRLDTSFSSAIIVDNIPIVPPEKLQRLTMFIEKLFKSIGNITEDGLSIPTDEKGHTLGFAFIQYETPKEAMLAKEQFHNYSFDKNHTFIVNTFEEADNFLKVPDELVESKQKELQTRPDPYSWVKDRENILTDQFILKQGDDCELYQYNKKKINLIYKSKSWTDSFLVWSPFGTYLTTFHFKGIILWSGADWVRTRQFEHPNVKLVDFSPHEKYLVSFAPPRDNRPDVETLILWDVALGKKIRGLATVEQEWPILKWSHDDKYFARLYQGKISVFEMPSAKLYHKFPLENIKNFSWSPAQNFIACWTPEVGNSPAKVYLLDAIGKKEKKQKSLFAVQDVKMFWQDKGEYMCATVDKLSKSKKTQTSFEIFFVKEKDVPVETVANKMHVTCLAWEPSGGSQFAVIQSQGSVKPDICFYGIKKTSCTLIKTVEKRQANSLFWSPKGRFVIFAGIKSFNGSLEFYDAQEYTSLSIGDHYAATDVEWDPTGRFVISHASAWRHQIENGYIVWSFAGRLLMKYMREKFYTILWRPRPPLALTPEAITQIKKDLPRLSKKYEEEEKKQKAAREKSREEKRRKQQEIFSKFLASVPKPQPDPKAAALIQNTNFEEILETTVEILPEEK